MKRLGLISEIVRYPVKSMAGTPTDAAFLGWHGIDGDRRFAFHLMGDQSGMPWLTASRLPELLLYHPCDFEDVSGELLPTHVRTPSLAHLKLRSKALEKDISARFGGSVELMRLNNGIFDDAPISVISRRTMLTICNDAGVEFDTRRFRANIVLETFAADPFDEDTWVGGRLVFGGDEAGESAPSVSVTARDVRCMMINLDPDTAKQDDGQVLKSVVRLNANNAGVYGTVVQTGTIRVGQIVSLISPQ